jgi:hypothetical protein
MAAVAFDSLHYARQLEAAGMPREQAEVVAKGLTAMFVHNFDSLVTKDYLDTRFDEQGVKLDLLSARIDGKLGKLYVMFGVIMAALAIPVLQAVLVWMFC